MKSSASETGTIALGQTEIPFTVMRNRKRRRTLSFVIAPNGSLRIMAPTRASMLTIRRMLHHRADWIVKKLAEQKANQSFPGLELTDGGMATYLGFKLRLEISRDVTRPQSCALKNRKFIVNVPQVDLGADDLIHEVQLELRLWMKKRARQKLQRRMDFWASRLGVSYKKMAISSPERQWGSCSADNIIRLNWRLIMAPLTLLDYVVAHELAHVKHKDHSRKFWQFLMTAMPDAMRRRKVLRLTGHTLTLL